MTNYTKSTNFATKDSLPVGNALKVVKGTEIDTEFNNIAAAVATKADVASPTLLGIPTRAINPPVNDSSLELATTNWVQNELATEVLAINEAKAPKESPTFTGVPAAPTAAVDTNTTQLATTAFVIAQAATAAPLANGTAAVGTSKKYARQDHVHAEGGIGIGQTWQNVTSSRSFGTTYTNSTGKPIMAAVSSASGQYTSLAGIIDGVTIQSSGGSWAAGAAGSQSTITLIIPNGSTYTFSQSVSSAGSVAATWFELR